MKYKCLVLFSGGLDSMLAVKILQENGINVVPLCFESFFFSSKQAKKSAQQAPVNQPQPAPSDQKTDSVQ